MARGLVLQVQGSNPLPLGENGIYCDAIGDIIQVSNNGATTINVSQTLDAQVSNKALTQVTNGHGVAVLKGTPVRMNTNGDFIPVDITSEDCLRIFGLAFANINPSVLGDIITSGRIDNVSLTASFGDVLYITPDGSVKGTSELTTGGPSIGNNGFLSGHYSIRLGVVAKNLTNPVQKDIIVNIQLLGQL